MKKQLLLGLMAITMGFSACKKDIAKAPEATPVKTKQKVNVVDPGTVIELTLAPRQPGENFDTYLGNWGGVSVKVHGTPSWNHDLYPNLVNGVPCTGVSYSVGDQNQISGSTAGGQDFFIVGVATATFSAHVLPTFNSDVSSYANAFNAYFVSQPANTTIPPASNFVMVNYGDGSTGYVYVTGKLIRITTGTSHFAFASVGYPTPVPPALDDANLMNYISITDPAFPSMHYELFCGYGYIYHTQLPNTKATGTYTTAGTVFHFVGTITRADGSTFPFDITTDIG